MLKNILKILMVGGAAYVFARFFLYMCDFVYAIYSLTTISKIIPFIVVIVAFWMILIGFLWVLILAFKDIEVGLNFVIYFLPMSALPFILLGVPQAALNQVFICRSSVIIFALFLVAVWFVQNALVKKYEIRLPFLINILAFLLLYVGHFFSVDSKLHSSVVQVCFVWVVVSAFFYFIVAWVQSYEVLNKIMKVMAISCIVQAILSFFSFYYYVIYKGERIYSFSGFLRDYELFAEYLAIHVPLLIFMMRNEASKRWRKIFRWGLFLVVFVLIATVIRGAIASLMIGMVYYFVNLRKISRVSQILKMFLLFVVVCAVGLLVVYQFFPASARIIERFVTTDLSTGDSRRFVWLKFFDYFGEKPVWGHGMFYNLPGAGLFYPHSTYFYYLLTIGVVGLVNYLIVLGGMVGKAWENMRLNQSIPRNFELAVALNTSFIIIVIDGLKVDHQRYSNYQLFIWIIFGLVVALNHLKFKLNHAK